MKLLENNEKILYEKLHVKGAKFFKLQLPLASIIITASILICIYFSLNNQWTLMIILLVVLLICFIIISRILRDAQSYYILTNYRIINITKNTLVSHSYENIQKVDFNITKKHIKLTFKSNPSTLYFYDSKNYNDFTTVICTYVDINKTNLKELSSNLNHQ